MPSRQHEGPKLSIAPNPGTRFTISFGLPAAGAVDLAIFDVTGRRVARVAKGEFPAGRHERAWNGCARADECPPAGLYYCRLVLPSGERLVRRFVIR